MRKILTRKNSFRRLKSIFQYSKHPIPFYQIQNKFFFVMYKRFLMWYRSYTLRAQKFDCKSLYPNNDRWLIMNNVGRINILCLMHKRVKIPLPPHFVIINSSRFFGRDENQIQRDWNQFFTLKKFYSFCEKWWFKSFEITFTANLLIRNPEFWKFGQKLPF